MGPGPLRSHALQRRCFDAIEQRGREAVEQHHHHGTVGGGRDGCRQQQLDVGGPTDDSPRHAGSIPHGNLPSLPAPVLCVAETTVNLGTREAAYSARKPQYPSAAVACQLTFGAAALAT